jgi:hypothetical protein
MMRSVDRLRRDRQAVLGRTTALGLALAALVAAGTSEANGQTPELSPPSEMPIISKPATPSPTPSPSPARPAPTAPRGRATLAIPGLTTPTVRPPVSPDAPKPVLVPAPGELSLDAPIEMRPLPQTLPSSRPAASPPPSNRPLVLESTPMDGADPLGGATTRPKPPTSRPTTTTTPPQPAQAPARRSRLFGFLAGPAAPPARPPSTAPATPKPSTAGRSVAADPLREDPAADSALKRRIERQAREVVGNRARSVEVKLDGKEAAVVVSGVKFFQKRAVRKQLEGIPSLAGLRSTIEVVD